MWDNVLKGLLSSCNWLISTVNLQVGIDLGHFFNFSLFVVE